MKKVKMLCTITMTVLVAVPATAQEQRLRCAAPGYTATYSPAKTGLVPMVDVTFRAKPSSTLAEAALRK